MKIRHKSLWIITLCMVLSIFACVTINIYFPAEEVKSVAGEIVDEIRDRKSTGEQESRFRRIYLAMLPSIAYAQDVTSISNPTIRGLKQNLKARYPKLKPYYTKGMLKEGNNGYLTLEKPGGLKLKEKRDITNLVTAENKDRKKLYSEVAKALKIDGSQVEKVAKIFAKEWQK